MHGNIQVSICSISMSVALDTQKILGNLTLKVSRSDI